MSGWNGDVPRRIRVDITLNVSKMGIDNIERVKGISPIPSLAKPAQSEFSFKIPMTNIDIIMPMTSVPPSPMNILVLLPNTLCRKNGTMAPAAEMARVVITVLPDL